MDFRPLLKSMNSLIEQRLSIFETALPGVIRHLNGDGTVDVLPSIRANTQNGVVGKFDDKPILGVQLLRPGNATFTVDLAPREGDQVLLLFFSRSARGWKEGGWKKEPSDPKGINGNTLDCAVAVQIGTQKAPNTLRIGTDGKIEIDAQEAAKFSVKGDVEIESTEGKIRMKSDVIISGSLKVEQDVTAMYRTEPVTLATHVHPSAMGPTAIPTLGVPEPETP